MEVAKTNRTKAEQKAKKLAETIQEMKQDGETAYNKNVHPHIQKLNVTYERKVTDKITVYKRERTLLPIKIDGKIMAVFPSRQIGFTGRSDRAPDGK